MAKSVSSFNSPSHVSSPVCPWTWFSFHEQIVQEDELQGFRESCAYVGCGAPWEFQIWTLGWFFSVSYILHNIMPYSLASQGKKWDIITSSFKNIRVSSPYSTSLVCTSLPAWSQLFRQRASLLTLQWYNTHTPIDPPTLHTWTTYWFLHMIKVCWYRGGKEMFEY